VTASDAYFKVGARVVTADFGSGTVVKLLPDKAIVRLDTLEHATVEQLHASLRPLVTAPAPVAAQNVGPPGTTRRVSRQTGTTFVKQRQAIEALRFGLVPPHSLDELTLGYDDLREWIVGRLPESHGGSPQASAVFGPFGTGKSHTMAVIRHVAERLGYLTAHVEVDGKTVSLAEPERLLHALWGTLHGADFTSATPLIDLYLRAIRAGRSAPTVAPRGIDRIHNNYLVIDSLHQRGMLDEHSYALDGILSCSNEHSASEVQRMITGNTRARSGANPTIKRMIGNTVVDRPYDLVESLAGNAIVAQLAGLRGLVVTIDEFEVEQSQATRLRFERVERLLSVIHAYLQGDTDHRPAPLALFFATVGATGHVGDNVIEQLIGTAASTRYSLQPWSTEDLRNLAQRIHRLYCAAYEINETIDATLIEHVLSHMKTYSSDDSGLIRAFIKQYTAALDTRYGPPQPS